MKRILSIGLTVTAICVLVLPQFADGGQKRLGRAVMHVLKVEQGARLAGMGGTFVAIADDINTIFMNPAGLTQVTRPEFQVSFQRNSLSNDATMAGETAHAEVANTRFGSLGFVLPVPVHRGSLVLAAGFNRIKDFDWALHTSGFLEADSLRADDTFSHEGGVSMASLAAAVDVSPSVSLGLTLNLITGEDEATNEFMSTDTRDYFLERRFLDRETFVDDYESAVTATFGVLVRMPREDPRLRLGATISSGATHLVRYTFQAPPADRFETIVHADGTREVVDQCPGMPGDECFSLVEYDDGTVLTAGSQTFKDSYKISMPMELGLGLSYYPVSGLLVAGSVHLAEWSQSRYDGRDNLGLRANSAFETQYRDVVRYHLGVEYQVPTIALDLRAGFYTDPLPFAGPRDPERSLDPVNNPQIDAAQDRRFWTAGAGLMLEDAVRAELAWNRGSYERVEGTGTSGLREDTTINRVSAGLTYSF